MVTGTLGILCKIIIARYDASFVSYLQEEEHRFSDMRLLGEKVCLLLGLKKMTLMINFLIVFFGIWDQVFILLFGRNLW